MSVPKAPRAFQDDLESVLRFHEGRVCVVQLWRQRAGRRDRWDHLERLPPSECTLEDLKARFGGGVYRAKLLGRWMRRPRWEVYLEQLTFAIGGPPSAYTLQLLHHAAPSGHVYVFLHSHLYPASHPTIGPLVTPLRSQRNHDSRAISRPSRPSHNAQLTPLAYLQPYRRVHSTHRVASCANITDPL